MTCGWCARRIIGRHRMVEPYAFRGWTAGGPDLLDVRLVFHRRCWQTVKAVGDAAERYGGRRADDGPEIADCDCGGEMLAGIDHYCPGDAVR